MSKDDEFKAIYYDQKDKDLWKNENDLKGATDSNDAKSKIKNWCEKELKTKLPWFRTKDYAAKKDKFLSICTSEGIVSVKGRITQSGKDSWMGDKDDDKYKTVFAVFKFNSQFVEWVKREGNESDISAESKAEEKYAVLKKACESVLKKPYREIENSGNKSTFDQAFWWCSPLNYDTIKGRLQDTVEGWSARDQNDSNWEEVKNKWGNTEEVKKMAGKVNGNSGDSVEDLTVENLKKLCEETQLNSKLFNEGAYQEKYKVIKAVCKKETSTET